MGGDQARCRDAADLAERLLFDAMPADNSAASQKAQRDLVTATARRFATGDDTALDDHMARYQLLAVEYGAKAIARGPYCQTGVPMLWKIAAGVDDEAGIGQRSLEEVIAAHRRLFAAAADCAAELHGKIEDIAALQRSAIVHRDDKEFDAAIADFTELLGLAPQNIQALYDRGRAFELTDDKDRAEADYTAALRLVGTDADILRSRAGLRFSGGNYDGAIADYAAVLALEPDDIAAYINRAGAFFSKQDYAAAVADYTVAIERGPGDDVMFRYGTLKDVLARRAYAYLMLRDFDHAAADDTELLTIAQRDTGVLANRAYAYFAKQDYRRAIADDTAIIALDPNNVAAFIQRGGAYEQLKDYERAIADDSEAIRLDPQNAEAVQCALLVARDRRPCARRAARLRGSAAPAAWRRQHARQPRLRPPPAGRGRQPRAAPTTRRR